MGGRVIEPFPRGVLVGNPSGDTTYYSEAFDVGEAKSLAYWMLVEGAYPASVTDPVTAYIETSARLGFDGWVNLTPGGIGPNIGTPDSGVVSDPLRFLRLRAVVIQSEVAGFTFSLVMNTRTLRAHSMKRLHVAAK